MERKIFYYWTGAGRCTSGVYTCSGILSALFVDHDIVRGCYKLVHGKRVPCLGEFIAYVRWAQDNFAVAQRKGFLCATKKA